MFAFLLGFAATLNVIAAERPMGNAVVEVGSFFTNVESSNGCVSFTVGSGSGCAWMCNYCSSQLGTNNYYFTDGVCKYQGSGCVGNPIAGQTYTCCAV